MMIRLLLTNFCTDDYVATTHSQPED